MTKDVFDKIDTWNSRLNFLAPIQYWRISVLLVALTSLSFWMVLGFDSGIGMMQTLISNLPSLLNGTLTFNQWWATGYEVYGVTGHFSSVVTYCFLFVLLSQVLEKLGFTGSKNFVLTLNLTFFNGAVFEIWYQFSYAVFRTPQYLVQWLTEFFGWYLVIFFGGTYCILFFWAHTYNKYKFKATRTMWLTLSVLAASMILWWWYPFPITIHNNAALFPQTVYAGMIYVPNNGVRAVNIVVKGMFAITQFALFKAFKKAE